MSQQHNQGQGRPQGGQHGGYDEGRRQSQGGYGEDNSRSNDGGVGNTRHGRDSNYGDGYGSQEPWRAEGQGNPPRDWDDEAGNGRRENRESGNLGRQNYGNYRSSGGGSQRRPHVEGQSHTGAYGLDAGPLRGTSKSSK